MVDVPASSRLPHARFGRLDALRGAAMVWMTLYHFGFDLNYFKFWQQDFLRDPFWTWQRIGIVSLFLLCAGMGQAVAAQQGVHCQRFLRRWTQVAAGALVVSAGSFLVFPLSFIHFGILHSVAVMLIVARLTVGWRTGWLLLAGAVALALPSLAQALLVPGSLMDALNERPHNWLGLVTRRPYTEDYVPVFPWLGMVWWGLALGRWLLAHRPHVLAGPLPRAGAPLAWLGRHSLVYYLLHQPVMFVALMAWDRFLR
ncbi:hypothetical protein C6568_02075 [Melaminivora suipulveris]|uniref:Heparan-alpha-glucosaminide N-acetyltransferase catalytic domain-containing protein n=1 Tax=Melaminivora suipulveris TaxID=2109913 RepID=A0A2R3Q8S2_9BURK|nr:heparan-alpha-glucosaminide N-acetyltransferase [Melaminivora suipulveris]AVO48178.1 hypothetical protein C6568_02075 [Melaminivora suipulveris]